VLSDTTDPVAVVEAGDASAQNIAAITGNFSVSDLDVGDTLTPSIVGSPAVKLDGADFVLPPGAAALTAAGVLTLTGTTSDGGSVNIGYSYDPAAANLDFLAAGQSLTITYTVKVNDGTADSTTQDVTFTITGTNDAPVITNLGPAVNVTEQVAAIVDSNVTISDAELDAANGGVGNYAGSSLTVARTGGANAEDALNFNTSGASFTVSGSNLMSGGNIIATFTAGSSLVINFTSFATAALVDNVVQHITYTNTSDTPPASIGLSYTFSDGSASDTEAITVNITAVDDGPIAVTDNVITNVGVGNQVVIQEWALLNNDPAGAVDVSSAADAVGGSVLHTPGTGSAGTVTFTDTAPAGGSFTYTATDGTSAGPAATVNVSQDLTGAIDGTANGEILVGAGTLIGNGGNDILLGSAAGNTTYQFGLNDGSDIVYDAGGGSDSIVIATSSPTNSTQIGTLNFERVGNDLVIDVGSDHIVVKDQYITDHNVESVQFSNGGTVYGYALNTTGYNLDTDLSGGGTADVIASAAAGETLNGGTGNGNDLLFGNDGADTMTSGAGNDLLVGGLGNDTMNGGDDNDTLVGGQGLDTMTGGAGDDTFYFASVLDTGNTIATADIITDFKPLSLPATEHDTIDLSAIFAGTLGVTGAGPLGINSVGWSQSGADTIVQADVTGDAIADVTITLQGVSAASLSAGDFIL
jgi:VCBS repeat-containing protein